MKRISFVLAFGCLTAFAPSGGMAQAVTGGLGSATATTIIAGTQVLPPDPAFGGATTESTPWWHARILPPKGARLTFAKP